MSEKLFGVNFTPEEITIDETGKVVINNPKMAEAVMNAKTAAAPQSRSVININCPCPGGGGSVDGNGDGIPDAM
ncbi:hypothetical protein [Neobacillus sp. LXY-4]|uniref:hypothetical protein n=1 Tax=Neobacillus sp. LXY-4 TaxID=3379826 RepID=UPI003EE19E6A